MMKTLIVTVAGTATRFNRDTKENTLKCLYTESDYRGTLLYQILKKAESYDCFIIVGGYLFDKLECFIAEYLVEYRDKIKLVYNEHYRDYGSGYSLLLGVNAIPDQTDEVVFVEGDLFYSDESFAAVDATDKSVITVNRNFITSQKAVALYINHKGFIRYVYDTAHKELVINEPFLAIYNSAQIWKFTDIRHLLRSADKFSRENITGTNLGIIQNYFGDKPEEEYEIVEITPWFNCNTVSDYRQIKNLIDE